MRGKREGNIYNRERQRSIFEGNEREIQEGRERIRGKGKEGILEEREMRGE
jgi:hypothetical protein